MSKHLDIYQILENCRSDPLNSQVHQEKSSRSINRNRREERHSCVNDQMQRKKKGAKKRCKWDKDPNSNKDEKTHAGNKNKQRSNFDDYPEKRNGSEEANWYFVTRKTI